MRLTRTAVAILTVLIVITACKTKQKAPAGDDSKTIETGKMSKDFVLGEYFENGEINFNNLKKQGLAGINDYFSKMKSFDLSTLKNVNEQKAFWINIYNMFVLKLLAENYPENNSIFKVEGFMNSKFVTVGGRDVTLFDIDNEILRFGGQSKDPRINFALFNGTVSSAPLMEKMYTGNDIDSELDSRTRKFLANPNNIELDKKNKVLKISQIFEYFNVDFEKAGGIIKFVSKYLSEDMAKFLIDNSNSIKIEFLNYDWNFKGFPPSKMEK